VENDSGRADIVGEVESFVHREQIEAGTGADDGSRGIGQACAVSVGRQEGAKNADGLRPRNPACPDAIRGRATTLHRSHGLVASMSVVPAGPDPDGVEASGIVFPGSSAGDPNPGLSVSSPLASFLGPEGYVEEQHVPRLVTDRAFLILSASASPAQRFRSLAMSVEPRERVTRSIEWDRTYRPHRRQDPTSMKLSTTPDQILQQLAAVIGVWEENPDFNCAKLGNEYVVRARKAIQGYFGPDSTQYAQVGGTRQSDRKSGGRRAKVATVPEAA
jgi:hypothetical protein